MRYIDPSGHEYCESNYAVEEDCKGITELLPDKDCKNDLSCYDAYLAYSQLVSQLGRTPTDIELLYMTAASEYWSRTNYQGVAAAGQEGLARNYFGRCGRDGCQGSEVYRFLAGYEVWIGKGNRIDGNSAARALILLNNWNGGKNPYITKHVEAIVKLQGTYHSWTSGYDDNRPWQWYGPFSWDTNNKPSLGYSSANDAILAIDLGGGNGFWMFTGIQDKKFHEDDWKPQEARPQ